MRAWPTSYQVLVFQSGCPASKLLIPVILIDPLGILRNMGLPTLQGTRYPYRSHRNTFAYQGYPASKVLCIAIDAEAGTPSLHLAQIPWVYIGIAPSAQVGVPSLQVIRYSYRSQGHTQEQHSVPRFKQRCPTSKLSGIPVDPMRIHRNRFQCQGRDAQPPSYQVFLQIPWEYRGIGPGAQVGVPSLQAIIYSY